MKTREGYAVARDGSPIYYRVLGEAGGVPLILSDGIGCDGFIWKYLPLRLTTESPIVHWHYRGHGRTPEPRDRRRVSMPDLADDLACVLDAAGVERGVLAGHSMGVQVCLEAYRRHRTRVAGLILVCGAYGHPLRTFRGRRTLEALLPWISFVINRAPRLVGAAWRTLVPTQLAFSLAARLELNPELVRLEDFMPYLDHIARVDLALFVEMLAHAGRHSAREVLPTVDVPTLIIAGDRDHMTPRALSDEMATVIPGARLLVVEGGSHTAPIERPNLVTEAMAQFLSGIAAAPIRAAGARRP
jgi:pimeloyl-ACP methyl ester carboxylesterase